MEKISLLLVVQLSARLLTAGVEVNFTLTPNRVGEAMNFSMECKFPETKETEILDRVCFQKDAFNNDDYIACYVPNFGTGFMYKGYIRGRATIGRDGRSLTIVNTSVEDIGQYGCQVSIFVINRVYTYPSNNSVTLDVVVDVETLSIENCKDDCTQNLTLEEQIKLTCTAKRSRPAATMNWFKHKGNEYIDISGNSMSNVAAVDTYLFTTISNLTFNVTELDNGFRIICQANNTVTGETRNSSEVYLNILFPPPEWRSVPILSRYSQVADTIYDRDIVNLTCSVAGGNPLSQLTWSGCPNGSQTDLSSPTQAVVQLQFVASSSHHGSVCTCTALQKYASPQERSSNVTLLIAHPPTLDITTSPLLPWLATGENTTVNATLNCTATGGYPPAALSWVCKENSTQNGTEGPSLLTAVPIVGVDDDKMKCVCEARNSYTAVKGRVFKTIQLDAEYHPQLELTALPGNMVKEHDSVHLMCSGHGNPSNITYRWEHGEWSMAGSNQTILNLNRTDTGNYSCTGASNSSRYGQLITVQYLPITVNYLDVQIAILETNLTEGDNVTLECQTEGVPSLYDFKDWTFQSYLMNDTQLLNGTRGKILHMENINYMESGTYTCVVNNTALVRHGSKLLPILHSPKLHPYRQASQQVAAPVNGNVTLSLYIVANPEPKPDDFVWTKVKPDNASRNVSELASSDGLVSNLTIGNVKESDYGEYCCEVANGIGEKLKVCFNVSAQGPPLAPTGLHEIPGRTTAISTQVQWVSAFSGGLTQVFVVEYKDEAGEIWETSASDINDTGEGKNVTHKIDNLTPATAYNIRVKAKNSYNGGSYSVYSDVISIAMKEKPVFEDASLTVEVSGSSVTLTWKLPTGEYSSLAIEYCVVGADPQECRVHEVSDKTSLSTKFYINPTFDYEFRLLIYQGEDVVVESQKRTQSTVQLTEHPDQTATIIIALSVGAALVMIAIIAGGIYLKRRQTASDARMELRGLRNSLVADTRHVGSNGVSNPALETSNENHYSKGPDSDVTEYSTGQAVGPDGTVYADLTFSRPTSAKGKKDDIIRTNDAVEYGTIDFNKKAPPVSH